MAENTGWHGLAGQEVDYLDLNPSTNCLELSGPPRLAAKSLHMRQLIESFCCVLLVLASCTALPGPIACTALYAYGVSATVTDQQTGVPIDNATLTLTEGTYQEEMQSYQEGEYVGAGERAGTYTLTAMAPGFQSQTIENIVVTADECHVHGVHLDVELSPQ